MLTKESRFGGRHRRLGASHRLGYRNEHVPARGLKSSRFWGITSTCLSRNSFCRSKPTTYLLVGSFATVHDWSPLFVVACGAGSVLISKGRTAASVRVWPIVIPVNMTGTAKAESGLVQDRSKNLFSIPILGVCAADHADIEARADEEQRRERVRLWYVAATRARDLLILPRHSADLSDKCWAKVGVAGLPAIKPNDVGTAKQRNITHRENGQTRETFAAEATAMFDARKTVVWRRPSRSELDQVGEAEAKIESGENPEAAALELAAVLGSSTRGTILHKLIEEVLTGETCEAGTDLETRAADLVRQMGHEPAADSKIGISAVELAATVLRTLALPHVATLRPRRVPELSLFGSQTSERRGDPAFRTG